MASGKKKKSSKVSLPSNSTSRQTRSNTKSGAKPAAKAVSTSKSPPDKHNGDIADIPLLLEASKQKTLDTTPEGPAKRSHKDVQEPVDGGSDSEHTSAPVEQGMFCYMSVFYYYSNILQQYLKRLVRWPILSTASPSKAEFAA
jgi:hypothetical protein